MPFAEHAQKGYIESKMEGSCPDKRGWEQLQGGWKESNWSETEENLEREERLAAWEKSSAAGGAAQP